MESLKHCYRASIIPRMVYSLGLGGLMVTTSMVTTSGDLELSDSGMRFPAVWLRDNCRCPICRDAFTGQRLFDITDVPAALTVAGVEESAEGVTVEYAPGGHRSTFARPWLEAHALDNGGFADGRTEDNKLLWRAADLVGKMPEAAWSDFLGNTQRRATCLEAVLQLGFVVLHGVPCEPGMVLRVTQLFGYVRETNYGRLFDVRVKPNPNNLAFTGLTISPHTDNPYRDPVPTLQLLHCLSNAAKGGDSGLVDGFAAAALLRTQYPAAFALLTRTPVPFAFADADAELWTSQPLIDLDGTGRIRGVRFTNRHLQPLRLPYGETVAFYSAYRRFAELVYLPDLQLNFTLGTGDCLIFDNTRVLHARTAFASGSERHLQGCYADLDSLASTLAVLRREVAG